VAGEGAPPLVAMPLFFLGNLQIEGQIPLLRSAYERLAEKRTLVRYDGRGYGLSERNVTSFSLDALVLDLAAVVDHLKLARFGLLARISAGPPAIAYAVAHPERVSHLVLWNSYALGADSWDSPRLKAFRAMREADWQTYAEAMSRFFFGGNEFAQLIRENTTPELQNAFDDATRGFDVTQLLPQVRCSTLVVHTPAVTTTTLDMSRALASRIPGARLAVVEMEALAEAADEFLGEGEQAAPTAAHPEAGAFRTILFTDIEGSTAMTQRLGDARAREVLREHERIVRECLRAHGGSEVKTMGDGFMASFGSATKALECAVAIQRAIVDWAAGVGAHHDAPLRVRIGLNAGEPIAEDDPDGRGDLFGTAVIRAARIAALAQGGEILVANVVRELAEGKGFLFGDRGEVALRGFDDPVRLFEVRWRE